LVAATFFPSPPVFQRARKPFPPEFTPPPILNVMQRVADWQLSIPPTTRPTGCIHAAGYAGIKRLAEFRRREIRDQCWPKARRNQWEFPARGGRTISRRHTSAIGQVWTELYFSPRTKMKSCAECFNGLISCSSCPIPPPAHQVSIRFVTWKSAEFVVMVALHCFMARRR